MRNQRQRLLARLEMGGLCAMEPLRWEPPVTRVAARIYDLKAAGTRITTRRRCPVHQHVPRHGASHAYYELEYRP